MARGKTYYITRTSDECGRVTVHLTPLSFHSACGRGHQPVKVRVTQNKQTIWNPERPLCVSPLHDVDTTHGRAKAASAAVDFLENARCGRSKRYD